jgi:hypothetical protein
VPRQVGGGAKLCSTTCRAAHGRWAKVRHKQTFASRSLWPSDFQTSESLSAEAVEVILRRILDGSLDPVVAIELLSPYAIIEVDANPSYVNWKQVFNADIPVRAADIRRSLPTKYLEKRQW